MMFPNYDTTRNGSFGYVLPNRQLGNYELREFAKIAGIGLRGKWGACWYTRQAPNGNPLLVMPDWCWQNYQYALQNMTGKEAYYGICNYLEMHERKVYVSASYGMGSIQFTLTEECERIIINMLKEKSNDRR